MSPTATRSFVARLAHDDAFRVRVAQDPRGALAEYGVADEPGLVPDEVVLPARTALAALGLDETPPKPPKPKPRPTPPMPINVQLFDPS